MCVCIYILTYSVFNFLEDNLSISPTSPFKLVGQFSIKNHLEEALVKNGIKQKKKQNKTKKKPPQITAASEKTYFHQLYSNKTHYIYRERVCWYSDHTAQQAHMIVYPGPRR